MWFRTLLLLFDDRLDKNEKKRNGDSQQATGVNVKLELSSYFWSVRFIYIVWADGEESVFFFK